MVVVVVGLVRVVGVREVRVRIPKSAKGYSKIKNSNLLQLGFPVWVLRSLFMDVFKELFRLFKSDFKILLSIGP